jgi:hypothetical protein
MRAFLPPGKASQTEVMSLSPNSGSSIKRRSSFTGISSRISDNGRDSPITGVISVNRIMGQFDRDIAQTPVGRRGLVIGNTQSELEQLENEAKLEIIKEEKKLKNMESRGKTSLVDINKQKIRVKTIKSKHDKIKTAIDKVTRSEQKRARNDNGRPQLKRTKSMEGDVIPRDLESITVKGGSPKFATFTTNPKPPRAATKPMPTRSGAKNLIASLQRAIRNRKGSENVVETVAQPKTKEGKRASAKNLFGAKQNQGKRIENNSPSTPNKPIPTQTSPPSIKSERRRVKNEGSKNLANERKQRREREGPPRARRSLEPIFNQIAKQKNTPPGITKTNIERLFQPFKQPVTVTVAPTISVKGGSAKQGIVMLKSNLPQKKKKTPPPKPQYLKSPATIRREKEKARSIAIRKQLVASMRTPTKGQRKTHVIQLIERVLRKMKAPKDVEKKLIKMYEVLTEKQIKSLFGGRSPEFVKKTLKKQVEYLKKKR